MDLLRLYLRWTCMHQTDSSSCTDNGRCHQKEHFSLSVDFFDVFISQFRPNGNDQLPFYSAFDSKVFKSDKIITYILVFFGDEKIAFASVKIVFLCADKCTEMLVRAELCFQLKIHYVALPFAYVAPNERRKKKRVNPIFCKILNWPYVFPVKRLK